MEQHFIGVRGGARTGYLIPGCDGNGAWTRPENSSAVVVVVVVAAAATVRPPPIEKMKIPNPQILNF